MVIAIDVGNSAIKVARVTGDVVADVAPHPHDTRSTRTALRVAASGTRPRWRS